MSLQVEKTPDHSKTEPIDAIDPSMVLGNVNTSLLALTALYLPTTSEHGVRASDSYHDLRARIEDGYFSEALPTHNGVRSCLTKLVNSGAANTFDSIDDDDGRLYKLSEAGSSLVQPAAAQILMWALEHNSNIRTFLGEHQQRSDVSSTLHRLGALAFMLTQEDSFCAEDFPRGSDREVKRTWQKKLLSMHKDGLLDKDDTGQFILRDRHRTAGAALLQMVRKITLADTDFFDSAIVEEVKSDLTKYPTYIAALLQRDYASSNKRTGKRTMAADYETAIAVRLRKYGPLTTRQLEERLDIPQQSRQNLSRYLRESSIASNISTNPKQALWEHVATELLRNYRSS